MSSEKRKVIILTASVRQRLHKLGHKNHVISKHGLDHPTILVKQIWKGRVSKRAWHRKGYALYNLGEYEKAIECYNKAIELDSNNLNVWHSYTKR